MTSHSPDDYDYYLEKAAVINQLNTDYNTIENANKIFNRVCYYDEKMKMMMKKYKFGGGGWSIIHECYDERGIPLQREWYNLFPTVFGTYAFKDKEKKLQYYTKGRRFYEAIKMKGSCGIEVVGMRPHRTKDGKYAYDNGFTLKELKEKCKMNKIKGYSKMDKCEIVSELMKI